jgi:hypothetical protein
LDLRERDPKECEAGENYTDRSVLNCAIQQIHHIELDKMGENVERMAEMRGAHKILAGKFDRTRQYGRRA